MIAPLDWGLGHATRCIPLIQYLNHLGCIIFIASSGHQLALLKREFPNLSYIELKGYNVQYSQSKRFFSVKILLQTPKIIRSIQEENVWLQGIIEEYKIDIVISDNRYGLHSAKVPCIFITHQLNILAGNRLLEQSLQKINFQHINRFSECWIPDFEGSYNIAGPLSHPKKYPAIPVKFIGPLARFKKTSEEKILRKYLIILSGPEPQRTILEEKILNILPKLEGKILIVRGKPADETVPQISHITDCEIKNHLDTKNLQEVYNSSEFIISRSGYTTVMELLSLQKKSVLIPTPGQTEQEFLAKHLMQQHWCYTCDQDENILSHIQVAEKFEYKLPNLPTNNFENIILSALEKYC